MPILPELPPKWRGIHEYIPLACEACDATPKEPLTACIFLHWWVCAQCRADWGTFEKYLAKKACNPHAISSRVLLRISRLAVVDERREEGNEAKQKKDATKNRE